MNVDIKLTHEQHQMLYSRLCSKEAIHDWLENCIDQELSRMAAEKNNLASSALLVWQREEV